MNELLVPFARSLSRGPVFASVVLDDLLRNAGLTWEVRTENVLNQLMHQASREQGHAQSSMQLFQRHGEVDMMGTLTIELVVVQGGAIKLSSAEFGQLLDLPPFWLMISTGQPCEVQIQGIPSGMAQGYGYDMPPRRGTSDEAGALFAAMLLSSAIDRQQRQQVQRAANRMITGFLLFEAVQIIFVLVMVAIGLTFKIPALIIFFVGLYLATWMNRGWFRRIWILITILWTIYTILF